MVIYSIDKKTHDMPKITALYKKLLKIIITNDIK